MKHGTAFGYAAIVSLGGFLFGFDASVISGVIGFVTVEFNLSPLQQGLVVSAPTLAAIVAGLSVGPLADGIGRKPVLLALAALYLASAVFAALAPNYWALVFGRAVGGIAFGTLVVAPLYIAEISPARLRGALVSFNQLNIMLGFSAAYFANYCILHLGQSGLPWTQALSIDTHIWNWMLGVQALPALIFVIALAFVPESPRWLIVKGRFDQARTILRKLTTAETLEHRFSEIAQSTSASQQESRSRLDALLHPKLRLALLVGLIVAVAQQITGINAIYFYAPTIFEQSGVGRDAAFSQAVWIGVTNIVFTLIAMATIDKLGRKPLLLIGLLGVFVSMSLAAYGFSEARFLLSEEAVAALPSALDRAALDPLIGAVYESDVAFKRAAADVLGQQAFRAHEAELMRAAIQMNPTIVLIGILGFVASFAMSLGPVMWVLLSEIFPNRIRGLAISFVTFFNSMVSFVVQFLFPWELVTIGAAATFAIYGAFALLGLVLVWRLLPETKGRSLEELGERFAGVEKARQPAMPARGASPATEG